MVRVAFRQVDVFSSQPFKGNPVAVIMDGSSLSTEQMQTIANWTNLSETTFVLPATQQQADYRVRIFTPSSELAFAGHPTIGTAYALLQAKLISARQGRVVQECAAGLINLLITRHGDEDEVAFELPQSVIIPLDDRQIERLEQILHCTVNRALTPALIDVGARWIVAQLQDAATVMALQPDFSLMQLQDRDLNATGVTIYGFYAKPETSHIEVRSFAPTQGINEDPVCGSGNGCVAAFIRHHAVLDDDAVISSSQGAAVGRQGQIKLHLTDKNITVGGRAVSCIEGMITL